MRSPAPSQRLRVTGGILKFTIYQDTVVFGDYESWNTSFFLFRRVVFKAWDCGNLLQAYMFNFAQFLDAYGVTSMSSDPLGTQQWSYDGLISMFDFSEYIKKVCPQNYYHSELSFNQITRIEAFLCDLLFPSIPRSSPETIWSPSPTLKTSDLDSAVHTWQTFRTCFFFFLFFYIKLLKVNLLTSSFF